MATPRWASGLLVLASLALLVAGLLSMFELRGPDRPSGDWQEIPALADRDDLNLVLVLIDTLRADRLSAYGYQRPTSPIFDALADSGVLFENVLAQSSWTKTSMASLWTATYPSTNRVTRYPHGLPDGLTTPAEVLQDAGFKTVGIFRNGWVAPNFGFAQGFDLYFKPVIRPKEGLRQDNPSAYRLPGTDHDLTAAANEFLRSVGDERFFLYLHYMDVHQYVYDDSADFGTGYSDIYDNSIRWVDSNLGHLVAVLQQQGLMKRTLLVVASDHGEAFREHGAEGHARDLYVETTQVPLLVALPMRLREGIRVSTPVENVDIWPTVFDLLGMPPMAGAQGRSLVPLIEAAARGEEPADGARPRFAQLDQAWGQQNKDPQPLISVQEGPYRLFHRRHRPDADELYDVSKDPGEQQDIAAEEAERAAALRRTAEAYAEAPPPVWGEPQEVALDDFELGQLRALGYVVENEDDLPRAPNEVVDVDDEAVPGAE